MTFYFENVLNGLVLSAKLPPSVRSFSLMWVVPLLFAGGTVQNLHFVFSKLKCL